MRMCALGDIFQAKVDELIGDIEGVKTYIGDILVLSKDCFINHIEHLRIIFSILRAAGLKVNAPKCNLGLKEITYLGYVITRDGVQSKMSTLISFSITQRKKSHFEEIGPILDIDLICIF